jgi:hypothetical protein
VTKTKKSSTSKRATERTVVLSTVERSSLNRIAETLLTLPFAYLKGDEVRAHHKLLVDAVESVESPGGSVVAHRLKLDATRRIIEAVVEIVHSDASINEAAGNYRKADIEHRWCDDLSGWASRIEAVK